MLTGLGRGLGLLLTLLGGGLGLGLLLARLGGGSGRLGLRRRSGSALTVLGGGLVLLGAALLPGAGRLPSLLLRAGLGADAACH